jgi:ketosteroid isomerase-like protein
LSTPTPSLGAETEALRKFYAAHNRGDVPAMVAVFDPQIEWHETWDPARYRGLAEVETHIASARQQWAEGACEPEEYIAAGNEGDRKIVVFVHVRARLKHETEWREGRLADVYTFRGGKVVDMRSFLDRQQALEWAGA